MTNDVDEGRDVRAMLASVLEGDTGPRHSPEEVLRSARRATAQRRAIVTSALSVTVVLAVGAGVFLTAEGRPGVESAAGPVLTTTPTAVAPGDVPPVPNTPEHAAELTAKLAAANVIPAGFELTAAAGAKAGPMEFYPFGADSSDGYKATAVFADAKGRATLTVFVRSASTFECAPGNNCTTGVPVPGAPNAEPVVRIVDGIRINVVRDPAQGGAPSTLGVRAHYTDGTIVHVTMRNEVEVVSGDLPTTQPSTRDSVPLTEEQLMDIAVKPDFHY